MPTVYFERPEYLYFLFASAVILAVLVFWIRRSQRRRFPADAAILKEMGRFPSGVFWLGWYSLLLAVLGGHLIFLSRPFLEREVRAPKCSGGYVIFIRDTSDSMRKENAVLNLPVTSEIRPNALYAVNLKIKELVSRFDCFQAALVDFQNDAGVTTNFLPIPEKRSEFLLDLASRPVYAPGSVVIAPLFISGTLIEYTPATKNKTLVIFFSDGGDVISTNDLESFRTLADPLFLFFRENHTRILSVGVGTSRTGPLTAYSPLKKKFIEMIDGPRVGRFDGALEIISGATGGIHFIYERYPEARARNGRTPEEEFEKFVGAHKVTHGEEILPQKRVWLGWYAFLGGTVSFLIIAGFLNWLLVLPRKLWKLFTD